MRTASWVAIVGLAIGVAVAANGTRILVLLAVMLLSAIFAPKLWKASSTVQIATILAVAPLDQFQVSTPLASITAAHLLLLYSFLSKLGPIAQAVQGSPQRQIVMLLSGWIATFLFRIHYAGIHSALGSIITASGFLMLSLLAMTVEVSERSLGIVACGAIVALAMFGAAALAAATGHPVFYPAGTSPNTYNSRTLFGLASPFPRTYGLPGVPIDAVAFLGLACFPYLVYQVSARHQSLGRRLISLVVLAPLCWVVLQLFQARGMVLTILLCFVLTQIVTRKVVGKAWLLTGMAGGLVAVNGLLLADSLSSGLRAGSNIAVVHGALTDPIKYIFGTDQNSIFLNAGAARGFDSVITTGADANAIHNAFLSALAGNGYISFVFLVGAFGIALWYSFTTALTTKSNCSRMLLIAMIATVFEMNLEPARAVVMGNWVVLGLVLGRSTFRGERGSDCARQNEVRLEAAESRADVYSAGGNNQEHWQR